MIAIYSNNYITDYYISNLNFNQQPYQVYHSAEQYAAADADTKIALINHINSYEIPATEEHRLYDVIGGRKFSQEIGQTKICSDLVIAIDNEIHPYLIDIFQQHSDHHVYWAIPGQSNDPTVLSQQQVILSNEHFKLMLFPYQEFPVLQSNIKNLSCDTVKTFYFDALLGSIKPHRNFVYNSIQHCNLQQKIIVTYGNHGTDQFKTAGEWEPDIEQFDQTIQRSTDNVQYQGHTLALCRILPIQVYNRTAYSIVAETSTDNRYSFFTEKTAKPIMAQRLFVVFSGYKFLQNLRALGFQTFGNVIDESYDLIYNDQARWAAAFEQVQQLCNMDQQEVFKKIAPAVEHNYNLLMTTNWTQNTLDQIQQKINSTLIRT
jgi:hypothetical protein